MRIGSDITVFDRTRMQMCPKFGKYYRKQWMRTVYIQCRSRGNRAFDSTLFQLLYTDMSRLTNLILILQRCWIKL